MILLTIVGLILWSSICEWLLHRFVMHKAPFGFEYAYTAHTKVHHSIYKYDETYHAQEGDDGKKIPMASGVRRSRPSTCSESLAGSFEMTEEGSRISIHSVGTVACWR